MAKKCAVCGNPYRSGQVGFLFDKGRLRGCRACPKCVKAYGILLIMATPAVELAPKTTKLSPSKLRTHLKAMVKVLEKQEPEKDPNGYLSAKIEGLEAAIEAIDTGRFSEG